MTRPSAQDRGYGSAWHKARAGYLRDHPLCTMCLKQGRSTEATVVDHVVPHRGDRTLFWDKSNWQPLCEPHHNSAKRVDEVRGYSVEIGTDGWPVDPNHPTYVTKYRGRV